MTPRYQTISSEQLLSHLRREPRAAGELFDRYAARIHARLLKQTADQTVADELTAETFAVAWRRARNFKAQGEDAVIRWLFGISHKLLLRYWERNRIESRARRKLGMQVRSEVEHDGDEQAERIVERLDAAKNAMRLEDALDQLPTNQRRAVELRVIEQLGYQQIAEHTGCSEHSARQRVSRGLRSLRNAFEQELR